MEKLEVEKLIKEHLAHKETGDKSVISGLFYSFKEEMLVALMKIEMKLGELSEHQRIANGRTVKLEGEVHKLREADVLMGEQLKNLRVNGEKTNGRIWQIIIGVIIAVILSALGYIIKTI